MPHLSEVLFGFGGLALCALVMILIGSLSRPSASERKECQIKRRDPVVRVASTSSSP